MPEPQTNLPVPATRRSLAADLGALGLKPGDSVLVHAALRSVGKVLGGANTILDALRDAVGPEGTVLGYTDWDGQDDVEDYPGLHDDAPVFDPLISRTVRDNGFFPELLRTTPGAIRSTNPGASMAAIGVKAAWFTAGHALNYGYGPQSPLGKLVEAGGKTLMLGAPLDRMTLLHHAEHLADFSPKRIRTYVTPMLIDGKTEWMSFEEFDTSNSPDGLADDYFATIVEAFLASGKGKRGTVGAASSVLVEAKEIVPFAVKWIERAMAR
jgi:aminoglycoside 3-N-acetyltransferase